MRAAGDSTQAVVVTYRSVVLTDRSVVLTDRSVVLTDRSVVISDRIVFVVVIRCTTDDCILNNIDSCVSVTALVSY